METTETMLNGNNLPRELLLTAMQTINLGNAIENNVPTDIKLSKAKISKIIQCWRFSGSLLTKLTGPLIKVAVPLTKKKKRIRPNWNNSCWFSNWCMTSKENAWFWSNNSNNFKWRNEW